MSLLLGIKAPITSSTSNPCTQLNLLTHLY